MGTFGNSWDIICTKECVYKEEYDNIKKIDFDIKSNELETDNFIKENGFYKKYDIIVINTYEKDIDFILFSNLIKKLNYNKIIISSFIELNAAVISDIYGEYIDVEKDGFVDDEDIDLETDNESLELNESIDLCEFFEIKKELTPFFKKMVSDNNNLFSWKYIPKEYRDMCAKLFKKSSFILLNEIVDNKSILLIDFAKEAFVNKYDISHSAINFLDIYTYKDISIIKL